jgi:hypothetical protein
LNERGNRKGIGFEFLERFEDAAPWKRGAIVLLVLAVLLCLVLPELVFQNKIFLAPDTKAPLSFASVGREALEAGTYPLWNPYLFCGMPSFGSLAYAPYVYPPSFVTHVLYAYLHFPEMFWLLAHYLLAGVGMYLLLRSLDVRGIVALFGGSLFMLLPNYMAIGANGHGSQAIAVSYMPLALLFARNILTGGRRPTMAAYLAIILGFQMLRGHVQISYYTYLLIGILYLFELVLGIRAGRWRRALTAGLYIAGACIAAVGIAAVLILPVREYAAMSIRGGGEAGGLDYGYATGWSLHPKEMLTFVLPWAYGFGKISYWGEMPFTDYPNYLGIVTVVFSIVALFLVENRWKWFFLIVAVFTTFVSFGKFLPMLYEPMFKYVPYFNKFRVPVMILIVQQLALVCLMGMGLEEYLRRYERGTLPDALGAKGMKWALIAGVLALVVTLAAGGAIRGALVRDIIAAQKMQRGWAEFAADTAASDLSVRVLFFVATMFVLVLASSKRVLAASIVLLVGLIGLVDVWTVDGPVVHPERTWKADEYRIIRGTGEREEFMQPDAEIAFLQSDRSYFRIFPAPAAPLGNWSYSTQPFSENKFMISRMFSLGGYHAAKLKSYQDIINLMFASFNVGIVPINILDMLNAKYLLSYFPLFDENSGFPLVWNSEGVLIYENPEVLPRVTLHDSYRVLPREEILETLLAPEFNPAEEVLLEREPGMVPESVEGSSVEIVDYELNRITLRAHVERPCILLLSEIEYPAWKASVDGEEVEILTADYCLRAISLYPGVHEIIFRFSSKMLNISLILSIAAFIITVTVPVVQWLFIGKRGYRIGSAHNNPDV